MRLLHEDDLRWVAGGLCKHGLYTSGEYFDIESNYYAAESAYNSAISALFDLDPNDPNQAGAYAAAEDQYYSASDWYSSASSAYGYMDVCNESLCDDGGGWGGQAPGQSGYWGSGPTGSSGGDGGGGTSGGGTGTGDSGNWFTNALSSLADVIGLDGSLGYDGEDGREWLWQPALDYLQDRWDALGAAVQAGWQVIQQFASYIWDEVVGFVDGLIDGDYFGGVHGGDDHAGIPAPPPPSEVPGAVTYPHTTVTVSSTAAAWAQGRISVPSGLTGDPTRVAEVKAQLENRIAANYDRVHNLNDSTSYEIEPGKPPLLGSEIKSLYDKQRWVFQNTPTSQHAGYAGGNEWNSGKTEYTVTINFNAIDIYDQWGPAAFDYLIFHEMGHATALGQANRDAQIAAWRATGEHLTGGKFDDQSGSSVEGVNPHDIPFENQERHANQLSHAFQGIVGITTTNQYSPPHGY